VVFLGGGRPGFALVTFSFCLFSLHLFLFMFPLKVTVFTMGKVRVIFLFPSWRGCLKKKIQNWDLTNGVLNIVLGYRILYFLISLHFFLHAPVSLHSPTNEFFCIISFVF